jgi:2-polyprenyl-6-methoxyphenol hydroxylase-like FAD-dependent oxidoreductase
VPRGAAAKDLVLREVRARAWHRDIERLFEMGDANAFLGHRLVRLDLPLERVHDGVAVLLGDAAHAMSPFAGHFGASAEAAAGGLAPEKSQTPSIS